MPGRLPKREAVRPPPRNPRVPLARVKQEEVAPREVRPPAVDAALVGNVPEAEWRAYADAHRGRVEYQDELMIVNYRVSPEREEQPPVPPFAHEVVVETEETGAASDENADEEDDDCVNVTADAEGVFKCKECENIYMSAQRLGCHVRRIHRDGLKFQCSLCDRRSKTAAVRNKHERQDHGLVREDERAEDEGPVPDETLDHIVRTSVKPLRNSKRIKEEPREDGGVQESRRRPQPTNAPAAKRAKPSEARPLQGRSLPPPTIPPPPVTPTVPVALFQTAPLNMRSESSSPLVEPPQTPSSMLEIMKALQKTADVLYYDMEKNGKRFGLVPVEVWGESEGSELLLVCSKAGGMRHPHLPAHFRTFAMPRPSTLYRAGNPAHLLCYAKNPQSPLARSLRTLSEKKGGGQGTLSFEDFVSILPQLPAKHIVAIVDTQEWPAIQKLGEMPHVDLF